jgi:2-hydroxy-3-keto-5-methylthiopentenyl-1-phosphate phosphatase
MQIVVDWDGTVTKTDGLDLVLREFGDRGVYEEYGARLGRELTLHEVIAGEFQTVRAPLDEVAAWVRENVRLREGFLEFARRHVPVVLSSGFHELIEPVLDREGLRLEVFANRVHARPEGWQVLFRDDASCSVCGEPCKRSAAVALQPFIFVGDGVSDHCVAEAAARVFARDGLSDYLVGRGVAFERFEDFRDLERMLESTG